MTDLAEQQTESVTPVEAPADTSAPATDDFSQLLAEYDQNVAKPAVTDESVADGLNDPNVAPADQSLDQLLQELSGPDPKIAELQGEVDSLRAEQHRAQEMEAFNSYADDLQKRMPEWAPSDYAVTKLKALAHDPTVALAFDYRNVDRAAANIELAKVRVALSQLERTPGSDPAKIAELQQYGAKLEIAVHSASILRKATLDIIREAEKLPPPIDPEATQIRNDVAWAVKGASAKRVPEPPPDFGKMSDQEFRKWKRDNLGWE